MRGSDPNIRADAADSKGELHSNKSASKMSISKLRSPNRHDAVEMTTAYTSNDTSKTHPGEVHGRSLQDRSDYGPHATDLDGLETTDLVGVSANKDGS